MFHTEMLSNGGRRILVLVNALMQMPPCVTNITCITQVTFKLINKGLLVDNGRLDFARFQMLFNLVANKHGRTVTWIFWLRSLSCALTISAEDWSLRLVLKTGPLSSLLSLIMTEVRSKRRAFYPVIFTSIWIEYPAKINLASFPLVCY